MRSTIHNTHLVVFAHPEAYLSSLVILALISVTQSCYQCVPSLLTISFTEQLREHAAAIINTIGQYNSI